MNKFYDTNALLELLGEAFKEPFYVSDISLMELEHIKTSKNKDEDVKYRARKLRHLLDENIDKYTVVYGRVDEYTVQDKLGFLPNNDFQIVWQAYKHQDKAIFVTNDISCKNIAKCIFRIPVESAVKNAEEYFGYEEAIMSDEELAYFYEHPTENKYGLLKNEYLIIRDSDGNVVDRYKWNGENHIKVKTLTFDSEFFGKVKPYKNDIYQQLLFDCLQENKMTLINGSAGTGKSYVALAYLMKMLDKGKIDKVVVFCNTVATKGAAKLGYGRVMLK